VRQLREAAARGVSLDGLPQRFEQKAVDVERYATAYRRYCWPVNSLGDLRIAPFHLLATEGHVHVDKNHVWHMETLAKVCANDPALLLATHFKVVDVGDDASQAEGVRWWEDLTSRGGEGMVVKPMDFVFFGPKALVQPAVK